MCSNVGNDIPVLINPKIFIDDVYLLKLVVLVISYLNIFP
jgi:hypothetical protein